MKKLNLLRAVSLPVASAMLLAACAPQVAPTANQAPQAPAANQAAPAAAQTAVDVAPIAAGTVKGLVAALNAKTGSFEPVAGATVKVEGTSAVATTDANGIYAIDGLKVGAHKVVATKDGMVAGTAAIKVDALQGLPNVDLLMATPKAGYGLKELGDIVEVEFPNMNEPGVTPKDDHLVSGVIRDVRGCAVKTGVLDVTTSSGSIEECGGYIGENTEIVYDEDNKSAARITIKGGFYAFTVEKVKDDNALVQMNAYGATAGGIKLERTGTAAQVRLSNTQSTLLIDLGIIGLPLDLVGGLFGAFPGDAGASVESRDVFLQMLDVQLNQFQGSSAPVQLVAGGMIQGRNAEIKVLNGLSSRADEFVIRLQSEKETYDVVPLKVKNRSKMGAESDPESTKYVEFRVPGIFAGKAFTAKIVTLGMLESTASPAITPVALGQVEWNTAITATLPTFMAVAPSPKRTGANANVVFGGDTLRYSVKLTNTTKAALTFDFGVDLGNGDFNIDDATFGTTDLECLKVCGSAVTATELMLGAGETKVLTFDVETSEADGNTFSINCPTVTEAGKFVDLFDSVDVKRGFFNSKSLPVGFEMLEPVKLDAADTANEITTRYLQSEYGDAPWMISKTYSDVGTNTDRVATVDITINPADYFQGPVGTLKIVDTTPTTLALTALIGHASATNGWKVTKLSTSYEAGMIMGGTQTTTLEVTPPTAFTLPNAIDGDITVKFRVSAPSGTLVLGGGDSRVAVTEIAYPSASSTFVGFPFELLNDDDFSPTPTL